MIHHVDIIQALRMQRFTLETEKLLQAQIRSFLHGRFTTLRIEPEYILDPHNVIDFLLDNRVGVEVKIKGSKREIFRQCERYCDFELIQVLILVTNLSMGFPPEINGKSCYVIKLGQAWL
jgi:hypothetical protein